MPAREGMIPGGRSSVRYCGPGSQAEPPVPGALGLKAHDRFAHRHSGARAAGERLAVNPSKQQLRRRDHIRRNRAAPRRLAGECFHDLSALRADESYGDISIVPDQALSGES